MVSGSSILASRLLLSVISSRCFALFRRYLRNGSPVKGLKRKERPVLPITSLLLPLLYDNSLVTSGEWSLILHQKVFIRRGSVVDGKFVPDLEGQSTALDPDPTSVSSDCPSATDVPSPWSFPGAALSGADTYGVRGYNSCELAQKSLLHQHYVSPISP